MYGKLNTDKSNESLRTRLDSSLSDVEKHKSMSPRLTRPIPHKAPSYLGWNLNSLFGNLSYLRSPIPTGMNIPNSGSNGLAEVFKPKIFQESVKFKANKIYDKFSLEDLEEMQLDYKTGEKTNKSTKSKARSNDDEEIKNSENLDNSDEKMQLEDNFSDDCAMQGNTFKSLIEANNIRKTSDLELQTPYDHYVKNNSNIIKSFADKSEEGMIGLLTTEQRQAKVKRYLEKKRRRKELNNSKVRYECRKDLADRRYRLQGRFVRLEDIKRLEKDYIFDSRTKKLIKPIFQTEKVLGGYKSLSSNSHLNSDSDVAMHSAEE